VFESCVCVCACAIAIWLRVAHESKDQLEFMHRSEAVSIMSTSIYLHVVLTVHWGGGGCTNASKGQTRTNMRRLHPGTLRYDHSAISPPEDHSQKPESPVPVCPLDAFVHPPPPQWTVSTTCKYIDVDIIDTASERCMNSSWSLDSCATRSQIARAHAHTHTHDFCYCIIKTK
jgi:hypothetical protein